MWVIVPRQPGLSPKPSMQVQAPTGTGEETSVNHLAAVIKDLTGYEGDRLRSGPARRRLRNTIEMRRARQVLRWAPTVDLREGLARTIAHYRNG